MRNEKSFEEMKQRFIQANLDGKIDMYKTAEGLSVDQFKQLLKHFPIQHIDKLERVLG
ncbi:MAG: hypothetical protein ACLKAK_07895 [Alkaliphilus sp.]